MLHDDRAMNAIWTSTSESHSEKLILAHLSSLHELGMRYTSGWKPVDAFIADFQERWCSLSDLQTATRLSETTITRTLAALVARDLVIVKSQPKSQRKPKEGVEPPMEQVIAVTAKIFKHFAAKHNTTTAAPPLAATGTGGRR